MMTRDLKQIKLGDFGISRPLQYDANGELIPAGTFNIGTVNHMAPEVCSGRPYGQATDIWGLGVVLYHLLNLYLPFDGEQEAEIIANIKIANYPPVCADGNYSKKLKDIVGTCLQVEPSNRPSIDSLIEIVDDLKYSQQNTT